MKKVVKRLLPALIGLLLGIISYCFFYGWYDVFPWAVVALSIGYISKTRRESVINGAIFGYFLFLVYIFAGYKGKTNVSRMLTFIPFDLAFSLVGAVAGGIGAFIGNWFKKKLAAAREN